MNLRHLYLLIFLLLCSPSEVFSQLPKYRLYRILEQDGLKTGDIVSIAKDRKGYLWICTQAIAQRFDGRQTISYPFTESILKTVVDEDDNCWVLTRSALYRFNNEKMSFLPVETDGEIISPVAIFISEKSLFALIDQRLYRFDNKQNRFVATAESWSGATRYLGDSGNRMFFGNTDSIFICDSGGKLLSSHYIGSYYFACPLSEFTILISTRQFETFLLNVSSAKTTHISFPIPAQKKNWVITAAMPIKNNKWFLATTGGWFEMDASSLQINANIFFSDGRLLAGQEGTDVMFRDPEGDIYLNSADGLFTLPQGQPFIQHLRNYSYGNEVLSSNNVRSFSEDDKGNIWMATTKGIFTLNSRTGSLTNIFLNEASGSADFPSYRQVLYHHGKVWVGTAGDGLLCRLSNGKVIKPVLQNATREADSMFNRLYVWKLLGLQSGKLLVVGGVSAFVMNTKTFEVQLAFNNPTGLISRAATQDQSGLIWHGTTSGLYCYDTAFNLLFQLKDTFPDKRIAAFTEWQPGRMLIGTKGLYEVTVSKGKPVSILEKKAIPSTSFIYCMAKDNAGFVWLGTDEGIYRYDPREDKAVFFDVADGAQTQAFNSDGAYMSRNGIMYMGGKNGINYFNPSDYRAKHNILQPRLQFVMIGDSLLTTTGKTYRFEYYNNSLDFLISSPEYLRPFSLRYRYRLSDNDGWTENGNNNRVRIGEMPAGTYQLQVGVSRNGQEWFTSEDKVSIIIAKPWWQTLWFRLLVSAAIIILIWQTVQFWKRRRRRLEQQQTIEYFTFSNADTTVDSLVWDIARNCIARLGFEDCVIYLVDEERQVLVQKAALGLKSKPPFIIVNPIEIPIGKGITGTVAKTGKTILVKDTSKDDRYIVDDDQRLSELAVPVIFNGTTIGVIDSEHKRKNFFTAHHKQMLETIASLCADKLATAQASEKVKIAESELKNLNVQMREASFANLRLQMNPHFLFNTLTSIQYLIVSSQVQKASNYLDIFSGFLRSLLNHAEDTVVTLGEELRILKLYVQLESLCLDETFTWIVDVEEDIDVENVQIPFMLLQPFVENAIHHGLIHKTGEKKFFIRISKQSDDTLKCTIDDNGIGRDASYLINQKKLRRHLHPSKGLSIVQERLKLLQQKTGRQAGFEIEDIFADNKPAGTRIHLLIPDYLIEEV